MPTVKRALLSVSAKDNLTKLAQYLQDQGVELIATGGTAAYLEKEGIPVTLVSEVTGYPSLLGGRVKTLHPDIMAAILARRDQDSDMNDLAEQEIEPIDLVVCNLYEFSRKVESSPENHQEIIEAIDIGGVTLIRAAAKNHVDITVLTQPEQYDEFINTHRSGEINLNYRSRMAQKAFEHTAEYDARIAEYFADLEKDNDLQANETLFPSNLQLDFSLRKELKYGENPHQKGALYHNSRFNKGTSLLTAEQLNGGQLSYNNYNDSQAALDLILEFPDKPAAAIVKHTNPCGLARAHSPVVAFRKAYAGDPQSAYGSIVALNKPVEANLAREMTSGRKYIEIVIAPSFTDEAVSTLTGRWDDIKLLALGELQKPEPNSIEFRSISSGMLIQEIDINYSEFDNLKLVTDPDQDKKPKKREMEALELAWFAAKHVRSNAVVLARGKSIVGVGAGQMSRVDAVRLAGRKAAGRQFGGVMASDAFFPYPDAIELAAEFNVKSIIQPGGSIRDEDVIKACKEHNIKMYFTGKRHFKH
ncbi:MAG: bifunctional phosphoribosylaminoimidazolecarboxamide formyltransferase/IMP cyclohydrolase [Bacillota bacterium]